MFHRNDTALYVDTMEVNKCKKKLIWEAVGTVYIRSC